MTSYECYKCGKQWEETRESENWGRFSGGTDIPSLCNNCYDPRKGWAESIRKARDFITKRNEELDKKGTCAK